MNASVSIRHEERERELMEIRRLADEVAGPASVEYFAEGVLVDRRPARWLIAVAAAAVGAALGMLVSLALIPDQPDRILIPVDQPAPSLHIDPKSGVQA